MEFFSKFTNNFGLKVLRIYGLSLYCKYLIYFILNFHHLYKNRNLTIVDKKMDKYVVNISYRNSSFKIDCGYGSSYLEEGPSFTLIKEICVSDCYFKYHHPNVFYSSKTVLDLGGNRGVFSALMASHATRVICVEVQSHYLPIIEHNMKINNYQNVTVEITFVGSGGLFLNHGKGITIDGLLDKHNLLSVDFLKIDIEGSEFALFESASWLRRVNYISMEVHPTFGDPGTILEALKKQHFKILMADRKLSLTTELNQVAFIYADRVYNIKN
jgi:hypothetical protein